MVSGTASRFFVLDFDRCIGNTAALQSLLEDVVVRMTSLSRNQLQAAQAATEKSAGSFDSIYYIQERLRENHEGISWNAIVEQFIEEGRRHDMLEPGAGQLLALLQSNRIPFGIVTYGGETWQMAKLQAACLEDVPYLITPVKSKGRIIAAWRKAGGKFVIPSELSGSSEQLTVSRVTLIDDKAVSFAGLPEGADGLYILPPLDQAQMVSQLGETPATVHAVRGLREAIDSIAEEIKSNLIDKA